MESGFQRLLLIAGALFALNCSAAFAEEDEDELDKKDPLDLVIGPDLERRDIEEDYIDTENVEISVFGGVIGVEDFGSSNVFGARVAYHLTEDFFLEATAANTKAGQTSFEALSGGSRLLSDDERDLTYYNLSIGINLLPGEVYLGSKYAFNTNYYVIFGAGNTEFAGNEYITYNFGGGFRIFTTDWLALRIDFRNHLFTHDILGEEKSIQNLEAITGLSIYF